MFNMRFKSPFKIQVYAWGDESYGALGRDDRLEEERQLALSMGAKKGITLTSHCFAFPFSIFQSSPILLNPASLISLWDNNDAFRPITFYRISASMGRATPKESRRRYYFR
jgi:hypothetical protein